MNDMYADAVLAVILQVESNPMAAQGACYLAVCSMSLKPFILIVESCNAGWAGARAQDAIWSAADHV